MFKTNFLSKQGAETLAQQYGTPLFVYARTIMRDQFQMISHVAAPYGLTVRYAMKANSHPEVLRTFLALGSHIDASSGYEAEKAMAVGFPAQSIMLTSQQLPHNFQELVRAGVIFNATSLRQLEEYGKAFPGTDISVRINPGVGSGHSSKVNVGGPASSFGIWHEHLKEIQRLTRHYKLTVRRIHTHIGAGINPLVWQNAAHLSVALMLQFPEAETLNLGGGFSVARMDDEEDIDMQMVGRVIGGELAQFFTVTGRKIRLELEPGTYVTANAGVLLAQVEDIVDTGPKGHEFIKLNTGMNDIMRPTLYGARHPIDILTAETRQRDYVVVGHNCESGDVLTTYEGKPDVIESRRLPKANIGDIVVIGGVGAYCASMAAHGYNSFPDAQEIII
jgi:diaminopimelate decarboxylase